MIRFAATADRHNASVMSVDDDVELSVLIAKATQADYYKVIHRVADKMKGKVRAQFLAAVNHVKSRTALAALADAIERKRFDEVVRALDIDPKMTAALERSIVLPLHQVISIAGSAAAKVLPGKQFGALVGRFDLVNPYTVDFINRYDFELINGLTRRSREGIRRVLRDAFELGGHPREQAEYIKDLVGLTDKQARAVGKLKRQLLADGHSRAFAARQAKEYARRLLENRAYNIARTETIRAANVGQSALWNQAAEEGYLNVNRTRREWIITPDDRLCPICRAIPRLNNKGVGLSEPFDTDIGPVMGPPAHPQCRCAQGLKL